VRCHFLFKTTVYDTYFGFNKGGRVVEITMDLWPFLTRRGEETMRQEKGSGRSYTCSQDKEAKLIGFKFRTGEGRRSPPLLL